MIRFEVITTDNKPADLISNPTENTIELANFYRNELTKAAASQTEHLYFESIAFEEKRSSNFQNINILEKCIMDFLFEHEYPKKVYVVCDSPEKAELYKVVYNFSYPEMEDEKLDDDMWD